jgi:hypothetical protein
MSKVMSPDEFVVGIDTALKLLLSFTFDYQRILVFYNESSVVDQVVLVNATNKVGVHPYKRGCKFKEIRITKDGLVTLVNNKQTITRRLALSFSSYLSPETGVQGNAKEDYKDRYDKEDQSQKEDC